MGKGRENGKDSRVINERALRAWKPIEYRGIKQGEGRVNNNPAICPGQWGEYNATC